MSRVLNSFRFDFFFRPNLNLCRSTNIQGTSCNMFECLLFWDTNTCTKSTNWQLNQLWWRSGTILSFWELDLKSPFSSLRTVQWKTYRYKIAVAWVSVTVWVQHNYYFPLPKNHVFLQKKIIIIIKKDVITTPIFMNFLIQFIAFKF